MGAAMAWDWIEKSTRRLHELGGEYKQHHALVERLLTLEPAAAEEEMTQAYRTMDERARAGLRMTLAGLTLSQQAAGSSTTANSRLERLKALQSMVERAGPGEPGSKPASTEARFTAGAARVTDRLADVAGRARPKADELIASARKGIEQHGPAVEAAVKSVITELLKNDTAASTNAPRSEPPPAPHDTVVPPPIPEDRPERPPAGPGSATIAGQWAGTLRRSGSDDSIACDLHVAATGRPLWAFRDSSGLHEQELTREGQRLQYVPPGGGVVTVAVQSVTGSASETGYVVDYSFEGSSNGYLTQKYQRLTLAGRLRDSHLEVTYTEAGVSSFGDKTGLAATEDVVEYRGTLSKGA